MSDIAVVDQAKVEASTALLRAQPPLDPHPGFTARYALAAGASVVNLPKPEFQDDAKDVWTSGSGSVVFADPFKAGLKEDILYSWEYAQRWANKQIHEKYGKTDPNAQNADTVFTHAQEWYGHFTSMLETLHWIYKEFDFTPAHVSGTTFTVDQILVEVLASFLVGDAVSLNAIKAAMTLVKSLGSDDSRMVLWDSHSNSQGKGTFQIGAVRDGGGGLATVRTGALEIDSTTTTTTAFFFFHYSSSDTHVSQAAVDLIFHDDAYTAKDSKGQSAKDLVEAAVVSTSNAYLANDGGIE